MKAFYCFLMLLASLTAQAAELERVAVSADGKGFVLTESKKAFRPWGVNYGNNGRLMEDFWEKDWKTLEDDFREIRELGGNVVRVHLQYGKFMKSESEPDGKGFSQLKRLVKLAETSGLYLDITGLAGYRPADRPKWYDALDEPARWKAQAAFWRKTAETCAHSPAVFCYDLMNEPVVAGDKANLWYSGKLFGDYDFLQNIVRERGDRKRGEIATAWIDLLRAAIREKDKSTLVTVGMLPWVEGWQHLSGFIPAEVAPHVDFLSVHIYPNTKKPGEARRALKECEGGKPVVIEEIFSLSCGVPELEEFLRESRQTACGWIWHYDGITMAEYDAMEKAGKLTLPQAAWRAGLRSFTSIKREIAP